MEPQQEYEKGVVRYGHDYRKRHGSRKKNGGVPSADRYRGGFQSGVWVFGGDGDWAQVHLSFAGAGAQKRKDLLFAGEHDGDWGKADFGCAQGPGAMGAQ